MTNKEVAIELLKWIVDGRIDEAYDKFTSTEMIHHNAWFKGDRESLRKAMHESQRENPNKSATIHHAIQEGDLVTLFSHIKQNPSDKGSAVIHIFRFAEGKVVEVWDVGMSLPEQEINENGVF